MEEILNKFGDDQSTLLDRFERLSFELQLNRAILGRSLSEPDASSRTRSLNHAPPPHIMDNVVVLQQQPNKVKRASSSIGFQKVMKKLLRPILSVGRRKKKGPEPDEVVLDHSKNKIAATITTTADRNRYGFPVYSKAFSRSVRV